MERFRKNMKAAVKGDDKMADLKAFDMVLFPVLEFNHYYLLVFELKNASISVIDNYCDKYPFVRMLNNKEYFKKDSCYKIKKKKHPKTDEIATCNIHKVKLEWATTNNYTDCGVFLMRHMDRFMGLHEMFECGFSKNGRKKLTKLKRLRKKMAAHILLSPTNVLRGNVVDVAQNKGKVVARYNIFRKFNGHY
ncbi:hypothetical protein L1987_80894 [Smallanthus sonchifolius]|uniref:Uncharacterized protein n=1 Tax=Smallanthus sonchifolius TaxID=185202 RepID=A0ACB8YNY3_9ASTR|nr:hypothetical protein L1987_80894 [Smallanthus sonchifolius]